MNGEKQETEFDNRKLRVAGIVAVFGAGLIVSGVLRFYNLYAENPPRLTAYSTVIYIGVTVIAAVLLSRARAHKMKKKWPWASYDKYLGISVNEIRKEFNIEPIAT